jgi:hypothetical protein
MICQDIAEKERLIITGDILRDMLDDRGHDLNNEINFCTAVSTQYYKTDR